MNYRDKLSAIMDEIELPKNEIVLTVRDKRISTEKHTFFNPGLSASFANDLISRACNLSFNKEELEWFLEKDAMFNKINTNLIARIRLIAIHCSPAKHPRKTKLHREFNLLTGKKLDDDVMNSIFNIVEYYTSMTEVQSIKHVDNDVHRKNIHQLITLMEKKYGTREKSSN